MSEMVPLTPYNIVGRRVRCKRDISVGAYPVFEGDEGVVFSFSLRHVELRFPWTAEHTKRMREQAALGRPFLGEAAFIFSMFGIEVFYDIRSFELESFTDRKVDFKTAAKMLHAFLKDFKVLNEYVPKEGGMYMVGKKSET
jgi:hypothetical protein